MILGFLIFIAAFLAGLLLLLICIPAFRRKKMGQTILKDGPSWHASKAGTPTMGGLVFLPAMATCLIGGISAEKLFLLLCGGLFWLIGALDDGIKIFKSRNLGLTSFQKFALQIIAALAAAVVLKYVIRVDTVLLPFLGEVSLGVWFIPFVMLLFLAVTNAVNLTDGIDGLSTSVSFVNCAFFAVVAFVLLENREVGQTMIALMGVLLAFFLFNHYPAKIFMGDTGALFLGGVLAGAAALTGLEIALLLTGAWFVFETLSVILQVAYFKTTGKRLFKMTPFHHHLEKELWRESKIVLFATVISVLAAGICYFIIM